VFHAEARSEAPWPVTITAARGGAELGAETLRGTIKDFDVVDGEERCTSPSSSTRRAVLRASAILRASA